MIKMISKHDLQSRSLDSIAAEWDRLTAAMIGKLSSLNAKKNITLFSVTQGIHGLTSDLGEYDLFLFDYRHRGKHMKLIIHSNYVGFHDVDKFIEEHLEDQRRKREWNKPDASQYMLRENGKAPYWLEPMFKIKGRYLSTIVGYTNDGRDILSGFSEGDYRYGSHRRVFENVQRTEYYVGEKISEETMKSICAYINNPTYVKRNRHLRKILELNKNKTVARMHGG